MNKNRACALNNVILSKIPKKLNFNNKTADIGKTKYLPSFTQEWKDTVYCYNKNTIKNIPSHHFNINKIIQSYFNMYFSNYDNFTYNNKLIRVRRRRKFLKRIYVSNPNIKYTNNKAIISLFTVNKERNYLYKKYIKINKKIKNHLMKYYILLYKDNIMNLYNVLLNKKINYFLLRNKNKFIQYKLNYLNKFLLLKNLYLKKVWSKIIKKYLIFLRKYELKYSLNQLKFNKLTLLNKLSILLNKTLDKKVEFNIINLKSILFNTDIFTQALTLKFKKKTSFNYKLNILSVLNRANLVNYKNDFIKKNLY